LSFFASYDGRKTAEKMYQGKACKTCGERFTDEKALQNHYDWHFQINLMQKKRIDSFQRGSRDWMIYHHEWTSASAASSSSKASSSTGSFFEAQLAQKKRATSETKTPLLSVVIADDVNQDNRKCPICLEGFKIVKYGEDGELWVYQDAINVKPRKRLKSSSSSSSSSSKNNLYVTKLLSLVSSNQEEEEEKEELVHETCWNC
jgi:hypothetical protein